jgi:endonuclease YncB( thermonuclease family)
VAPPPRRTVSVRFWIWLCIGTLLLLRLVTHHPLEGHRDLRVTPLLAGPCQVTQVISGDTLVVVQAPPGPGEVVVRLLSTETPGDDDGPEWRRAARQFSADFVQRGNVRLKLDQHRLDSQGRYLAYVECDGVSLNEALLAAGLARFCQFPGNSPSTDRRLRAAQEDAQYARRGLWGRTESVPSLPSSTTTAATE